MKLKRKLGFLLFFLTINLLGNSQNKTNNLAITLDLGGNSGFYTLNGEYEVGKIKDYKLNARIGFGYFPIMSNVQFIGVPIGINMLTGTKKHHLELGVGLSYIKGLENMHIPAGTYGNYLDWWQQSEGVYFAPSVGYRYDKLTGGLILKVYYAPLFTVYDFFDKQKFLDRLIPVLEGNLTKEEYYSNSLGGKSVYPTAKNEFGYFGISVGYRF